MSSLAKRMQAEVFTATWRVTGTINTHHIHIRDELNDTRRSVLIFREVQVADLKDMRAPRVKGNESWIDKSTILFAVPQKVRGATSTLTQRTIQSRLGKNEHRLLLALPCWRVIGHFYFVGRFQVEDALRRDSAAFGSLSNAEVTFLPDPSISFVADELAFSISQVNMLCSQFDID
jgi:hypothetical protein